MGQRLRQNWLEILLVLILLAALGWIGLTGRSLLQPAAPEPTPSPRPVPSATPTPVPTATPAESAQVTFDGLRAQGYVGTLTALGPRPSGSPANRAAAELITSELLRYGWQVDEQRFQRDGIDLRNIVGKLGSGAPLILVTRYDTRPVADRDPDPQNQQEPVLGANDGASGVAVLLELARVLDADRLDRQVWLAFLDGESRGGLGGWPDGVGAEELAQSLAVQPEAVIAINMVGDIDQQLFFEANSDPGLNNQLWSQAAELGYGPWFLPEVRHTITESHLPFQARSLPAVAIVDSDYPYWRTLQDTPDKIAADSLERVGRVLEVFIEE